MITTVIKKMFSKHLKMILFLFSATSMLAQTKSINIDDAILSALKNNNESRLAAYNYKKSEAAVKEAIGNALPNVNISASFSRFLEKPKTPFVDFAAMLNNATYATLIKEGLVPDDKSKYLPMKTSLMTMSQNNNYEAKAELTQVIFNPAVFEGIGATEHYKNTAKNQYYSAVSTSINNVKKAFYGAVLTKELLKIANDSYLNALENLNNVKAMNREGFASDFDLMQAEVRAENVKPQIKQLENSLKSSIDALKVLIGIDQNVDLDLVGDLDLAEYSGASLGDEIDIALNKNYDIQTLNTKRDVDQAYINLYKADYYPSLAAFANYKFAGSSENFDFLHYRESMVGISLSFNLFKGGQTDSKVEQYQIAKLETEQSIKQMRDFLTSQIKSKYLELERVKSSLDAQIKNVELAQRAYQIADLRFKEGKGAQLEIKNADLELKTAKTNKLQSVYDYIIASSELDALKGKIDAKYLAEANKQIENNQSK
jgi:outer membrane protein TolC